MSQFIPANPNVLGALLSRFTFTDTASLQHAVDTLAASIRLSTAQTAAYAQIPTDSLLPAEAELNELQITQWVHPHNVAAALINVAKAGQLAIPADLQVYVTAWQFVAASEAPPVQVTIVPPAPVAPPPPPVQAAPPAPPAPPIPAAPAAPAPPQDVTALVAAAVGPGPNVIDSTAQRITTPQEFDAARQAQGHPPLAGSVPGYAPITPAVAEQLAAPSTVPATPLPPTPAPAPTPHVPFQQAVAEAAQQEAAELPDPSVLAERRDQTTGRTKKSPFERKVEARNKIADAPFWWPHLRYTLQRLFAENPAGACDDSSTGSGPVQAYAVGVAIAQELLRCAPADATVAQLRTYLREVETGICGQPSADAINQIVVHLFGQK